MSKSKRTVEMEMVMKIWRKKLCQEAILGRHKESVLTLNHFSGLDENSPIESVFQSLEV